MPTFTIKSPDGRTFKVTAPEGTTKEQALARVQTHAKANPPKQKATQSPTDWKDKLGGFAGNFLDGILPGTAGAARGLREMAINAVQAPFSDEVDFEPMESFNRGKRFQEQRNRKAQQANPTLNSTAQVAGMGAGFMLPASKIAQGASLGQKSLAAGKTAGAYSAASGAMSSDSDSLWGKAEDALTSGLTGLATGLALPSIVKAAGSSVAPFKPLVQPLLRGTGRAMAAVGHHLPPPIGRPLIAEGRQLQRDPARATANRQMDAAIRSSSHPETGAPMNPMDVVAEVERRQDLGVPAVPADLDDGLRGRFRKSARTPGPATSRVRQLIDQRQAQEAARAQEHIAETLGATVDVQGQARALGAEAKTKARPLYAASNAHSVPYVRELQELMARPSARDAVQAAGRQMLDKGENPTAFGLIQNADGSFQPGEAPTMELYDRVKSVLDQTVFDGSRPLAAPEVTRASQGAMSIRSRLLDLMDGADDVPGLNPHWKPARDAYAGPIQNRQALELGEQMAKAAPNDVAHAIGDLSDSQRDFFRLGHRSGLSTDLRNLPDYGDAAGRLVNSASKRQALEAAHGPEASRALMDRLGPEQEATRTWQAVRPTPVDGVPDLSEHDRIIEGAAGGILQTLTGHPGAGLGNVARAVLRGDRSGQEVHGHVASVLGEMDPEALRKAMQELLAERARRETVEGRANLAVQHSGRLGGAILGTNIVDTVEDEPSY